MYRNCLFCKHSLGQNKTLEFLSVGRRVAFDQERGRLWVVCPVCGRWNLCPFDARWEALEECVRLSEAALLQEASGEIALLRHRHGLSMIRVGNPPLGELVSWRYARSLVRRRRAFLATGAVLGAAGGLMFVGMAAGWAVAVPLVGSVSGVLPLVEMGRTILEFTTSEGVDLACTAPMARGICLRHDPGGQVSLRVRTKNAGYQDVRGEDAGILLARAMPYINETGGTTDSAILAARSITERGGVASFLSALAKDAELQRSAVLRAVGGHPRREGAVYRYPKPLQLALEAASHINQEDRLLSGELKRTLVEWRSAEEEAAISDSLLEPEGWTDFKRAHLSDESKELE